MISNTDKIIPGILEKEEERFLGKINFLKNKSERIHIDVIDREYGTGLSLLPRDLSIFSNFKQVGVHLMVGNPVLWLDKLRRMKNCLVYAQVEKLKNQGEFIKIAKENEIIPGVAIDLDSPVEILHKDSIFGFKSYLLMSVKAGYSGQNFNEKVFGKYKQLRQILGKNAEILVDGGVNLLNAKKCVLEGFDGLIVNSYLWNNFDKNLQLLNQEINTI